MRRRTPKNRKNNALKVILYLVLSRMQWHSYVSGKATLVKYKLLDDELRQVISIT